MAVDFLGKPPRRQAPSTAPNYQWHQAEEAPKIKTAKVKNKTPQPVKEAQPVVNKTLPGEEINLVPGFRKHVFKKRLRLAVLIILVCLLVAVAVIYGLFFYKPAVPIVKPPIVVATPTPAPTVSATPVVTPTPIATPQPTPSVEITPQPTPEPTPIPTPVVLPDTELAPLRGALVRINGNLAVYLVDYNGELRLVENSAIFKNNLSLKQISPAIIYGISSRYATIRLGKKVSGQIDWDPRVLSPSEITSFK